MKSTRLSPSRLRQYDCVVISTAHAAFPYREVVRHARGIVDTRNALRGRRNRKIIRL